MQTFLADPDFRRSALLLDRRRLGKQRVEALQVLRGLTVPGYGWRRHPAVRMWSGYEEALVRYGLEICRAWCEQGHEDSCAASLLAGLAEHRPDTSSVRDQPALAAAGELPPWLGDEAFHRSHQSALVRKDPATYGPCFPGVPDDLPYVWPRSDREPTDGGDSPAVT
ncbi:MSMEG_6728 family protein [Streptomyces sp. ME02-8801-2C]|uniref:MSMEG_6728 family protein n=1 Tax=Streptomyces sp. ME02-8801-2C TaxID=3028680 RepID=UPI0029A5C6A1|nr:MSMEG_6728 family protein [Streptomyces sp. ME02-8801-2C]MDX3453840.1 MSMEG_6728 family protein [Streptomyces sp. ME02-8801-2C]